MHAAAHSEASSSESSAVDADPLPCSCRAVKPDRGDWEYLVRAVGGMRFRPMSAPLVLDECAASATAAANRAGA